MPFTELVLTLITLGYLVVFCVFCFYMFIGARMAIRQARKEHAASGARH